MESSTSPDRIVIVIVAVLCALALGAIVFWLGERRGRLRGVSEKEIRTADRAFLAEQFGYVVRAIEVEGKARIKAEETRLYERRSVG